MAEDALTVGGRTFHPAQATTFEQDLYVLSYIRDAGLDLFPDRREVTEAELQELATDLVVRVFRQGSLFHLLAGILVEDGAGWSLEAAEKNAGFFATLTDAEGKKALNRSLVGLVLGFFIDEDGSSKISLKSSPPSVTPRAARRRAARAGSAAAPSTAPGP